MRLARKSKLPGRSKLPLQTMFVARIPKPAQRHRNVTIPSPSFHDKTSRPELDVEMRRDDRIGTTSGDAVLCLGPRDMRQQPLAGADIFQGLAGDLGCCLDVDQAFFKLKRTLVRQVQAQHPDHRRIGSHGQLIADFRFGGNHPAFEQAVAIMPTHTVDRIGGIPDFEHRPLACPARDDGAGFGRRSTRPSVARLWMALFTVMRDVA